MKTLGIQNGNEITGAIEKAINTAKQCGEQCEFEFNGVTVQVDAASEPSRILRDWRRGMNGYLGKNPIVGPFPVAFLSAADRENDAKIEAENEVRRAKQRKAYEEREAIQRKAFENAIANAPEMEFIDKAGFDEGLAAQKSGYGQHCFSYAVEWARLMQSQINRGCSVAECADQMSHLADHDGITGNMYGVAVSILAKTWKHGEELRRWHNTTTQIGDEGDRANESGGVLNPAVLNIG